ncbi:MAG: carbamate kinase [Elusimicrobiota bacterium]
MPLAVIAVGGNSLIKDAQHQSVPDQYSAVVETSKHIVDLIEDGWDVIITHGNGPQVGFILRRSELGEKEGIHPVPLDSCGADTQGAIGYLFQQALKNEFDNRGIQKEAATVITRVLVDKDDPAFENPSKPIGSFMDEKKAKEKESEEGWNIVEDAGRGYRRVVPSPDPKQILEEDAIGALAKSGYTVIGVGGGGVPVYKRDDGMLKGVPAVIDKDYASALLATRLDADMFIISTAVDNVCLNFGQDDEKKLSSLSVEEAKKYIDEGHFAEGSMLPKIKAILRYIEDGGKKAVVTSPANLKDCATGKTGTTFTK